MKSDKMTKKIMRQKMKELIAASLQNNSKSREMESAIVCEKLLNSELFRGANRISVYVSSELEINTDQIVQSALRQGKELFIPRFQKGHSRMEMLRLGSETEFAALESTLWGIRQHPSHVFPSSLDDTKDPLDLIVLPGLAFTAGGKRLGHGRGYYDRFLNEYAERHAEWFPKTIGLALKVQMVDDFPMESHDRMVDFVLHA